MKSPAPSAVPNLNATDDSASTVALPIVVIGAGLAGLTCAGELVRAGQPVIVLEGSDDVGGRVRTDRVDGFLIDRGFQVILDAYPAIRRQVDPEELRPAAFDAGVHLWTGTRRVPLADPVRHPTNIVRDVTSRVFSTADKARLGAYGFRARAAHWESAREAAGPPDRDESALESLWAAGFSRPFINRFARPFWAGITLDYDLGGTAGELKYTLKMFLEGRAILPERGAQALPDRLLGRLPVGTVRLNHLVDEIVFSDGAVSGVRVRGEVMPAAAVVVATDPPAARRLTGVSQLPDDAAAKGSTTVFLTGTRSPGVGRRLVLDATGTLTINNIAPLSSVQPSYAPRGHHLISAQLIGRHAANPDDEALATQARADAAKMLGHDPEDWTILRVVRVPFTQFAQPPGIYERLPGVVTSTPGLYLAGEAIVDSSQNGAITSGELAARAVVRGVGRKA